MPAALRTTLGSSVPPVPAARTGTDAPGRMRGPAAVILGGLVIAALAGCAAGTAVPTPAAVTPTPTVSAAPSAVAVPPSAVQPELGAAANLAFFNRVAAAVDPATGGRGVVDALVAAGFDKATIEVGFDKTSVDLDADSVQFSVRFPDGCLIGQNGPKSGGYHSLVSPVISTGRCLIGATRQIDW